LEFKQEFKSGIVLGTQEFDRLNKFVFNPDYRSTKNPNMLIIGGSGSGKSFTLESVVEYVRKTKTIILFDFHNSLEFKEENAIELSPRDSDYGINPFEMVIDHKNGGPAIQAHILTEMFKKYFIPKAGAIQINVLKQLFIDTYALKGIYDDDVTTWNNELPTMKDLESLMQFIAGGGQSSIYYENLHHLKNVAATFKASADNIKQELKEGKIKEELEEFTKIREQKLREFSTLSGPFIKKYEQLFEENILRKDGETPDKVFDRIDSEFYMTPNRASVFFNLKEQIETIVTLSVFSQKKPRLIEGLNRIVLNGFAANMPEVAKFITEVMCQKIFRVTMLKGEYKKRPGIKPNTKCDTYIIIDEGKIALPKGYKEKEDTFNVFNRIATESRKYGLGLIVATQSAAHFSDEMLSNIYTKVILTTYGKGKKQTCDSLCFKVNLLDELEVKAENGGYYGLLGEGNHPLRIYEITDFSKDNHIQ
jgi:ABC-type dipeptide/oligopeptide/nickel transport system ATPase component